MKTLRTPSALLSGLWLAATLAACGEAPAPAPVSEAPTAGRAGMALTVDTLADTDIARMEYTITSVDCLSGEALEPLVSQTVVRDLEDLVLPGGNVGLEGAPFDAASTHHFADAFFWLDAGCYDVVVQPLQESGEPSADCAAASASAVPVFDGQTTEILLISQCAGEESGGLDVIGAVNHPPHLDAVRYEPSKFTCEGETTICVVASDPDNDPLEIAWSVVSGAGEVTSVETQSTEAGLESCATFALSEPGEYGVSVVVRDLGYDQEGQLVPIEHLLELQGNPAPSRDEALLPIHAMSEEACVNTCACPEGFELNAAGDACERFVEEEAQYNGSELRVCRGSRNGNYGALGVRFPGADLADVDDDTVVTGHSFFRDGFSSGNGSRLNTIGLWGCDANGNDQSGQMEPINEWIGFSRCVTVEEDGEYVVGIGADDVMRVRIDGQPIFGPNFLDYVNFRYWWMVPVQLTAGVHIFEMDAMSVTGPAAFAAEIYGPFAPGSTADDATMAQLDYENNIIWSTGDQLGSTFDLGTNSGYACADGQALNLCGDVALCTALEVQACE